ncbi:hypothetical protein [Xanthomonas sp. BRIP62411]|uniref:hypothetical protein n=1 Tax=Xanthomonas sp. BRIP62411 TaxID=2182389 RepID=UPI000F8CA654|nr:hypothetical protein [Xanthomonas sp. BRIP62411]
MKLELDSPISTIFAQKARQVADEVALAVPSHLKLYNGTNEEKLHQFGGNCGNVHLLVLNFLKKNYPTVPVNITIGSFTPARSNELDFSQKRFKAWLKEKPDVLDCHVWLTIGTGFVLDLTLATYINTRRSKCQQWGGTLAGDHDSIEVVGHPEMQTACPKFGGRLCYHPVALGQDALRKIGPAPA